MSNQRGTYAAPRPKGIWEIGVLLLAAVLLIIGLVIFSVASYVQTEMAFRPMNDETIVIFGLSLGSALSVAMAFIFQYGQGVALYIRKEYLSGKTLFRLGKTSVSQKTIGMAVFVVFAIVDAGTNVLWFYQTYTPPEDIFKSILVQSVCYAAMILVVFSEEVLGLVLEATSKIWKEFQFSLSNLPKMSKSSTSSTTHHGNQRSQAQRNESAERMQNIMASQKSQRKKPEGKYKY